MARHVLACPRMEASRSIGNGFGPRERALACGVDVLSDAELLAVVLGTGRRGEPVSVLSAAMLADMGGLDGLGKVGIGALSARAGVGPAKGARVAAAVELGRRASAGAAPLRVRNGGDVMRWARARLCGLDHEELWVLALDGANGLRAARRVAMGGLHGIHVAARDVLRCALREGASAFVLVHNHPSGDPAPSAQDIDFTERVVNASEVVGIPCVDHVVIGHDHHESLAELGLLPSSASGISPARY
jgi:DNA repair protein RadC